MLAKLALEDGTVFTGRSFGARGETFGEVESTKSVSDIYSPLSGTITERNEQLDKSPEIINSDPYGEGWLVALTLTDAGEADRLMDASAYREMVAEK